MSNLGRRYLKTSNICIFPFHSESYMVIGPQTSHTVKVCIYLDIRGFADI